MSILRDTEIALLENGWDRNNLLNEVNGTMCLLGGLATAHGLSLDDEDTEDAYVRLDQCVETTVLSDLISELYPDRYYFREGSPTSTVYGFNDNPETTFLDVISLIREADIRMGNIGEPVKTVEFEPMPETVPVVEPAAPAAVPVEEPVPA